MKIIRQRDRFAAIVSKIGKNSPVARAQKLAMGVIPGEGLSSSFFFFFFLFFLGRAREGRTIQSRQIRRLSKRLRRVRCRFEHKKRAGALHLDCKGRAGAHVHSTDVNVLTTHLGHAKDWRGRAGPFVLPESRDSGGTRARLIARSAIRADASGRITVKCGRCRAMEWRTGLVLALTGRAGSGASRRRSARLNKARPEMIGSMGLEPCALQA